MVGEEGKLNGLVLDLRRQRDGVPKDVGSIELGQLGFGAPRERADEGFVICTDPSAALVNIASVDVGDVIL